MHQVAFLIKNAFDSLPLRRWCVHFSFSKENRGQDLILGELKNGIPAEISSKNKFENKKRCRTRASLSEI